MQANPVSGSANADVLHRFVAAFNAKDEDALGKILTPDVVDYHLPPGLPAGIDGLKTWLGIVWAAFDAKLNLDDVVAAGDRVASRWTFAGTHIGEFNGLPRQRSRVLRPGHEHRAHCRRAYRRALGNR